VATPNIQAILQGILTRTDNTQSPAPYVVNLDFQNPTLNATTDYLDGFFQALTTGSNVPLGVGGGALAFCIIVINRSLTNNLQVTVTPTGGAAAIVGTFGAGGVCVLFDPPETGLGWTALTLTGIGATVPATIYTAK
jgi:hypothetical protein